MRLSVLFLTAAEVPHVGVCCFQASLIQPQSHETLEAVTDGTNVYFDAIFPGINSRAASSCMTGRGYQRQMTV